MERNKLTIGILAHVDAGKTTLCESMLYLSGMIRRQGRVDRRDCLLDNNDIERQRGITVFSKQAYIGLRDTDVYLLDTPGHADFSPETERTLQVLDCAVVVISGTDGVQANTRTVFRLLEKYSLPVYFFVTKMDIPTADRNRVTEDLRRHFGDFCIDFSAQDRDENLAMCSEDAMEEFLSKGCLGNDTVTSLIVSRRVFPVFFGSGLKNDGVEELLDAFAELGKAGSCKSREGFAARVFKIGRDAAGERLSYLKLYGGSLKVRDRLDYTGREGEQLSAKITSIRRYSGPSYERLDEVSAGDVFAVTGLEGTWPGQGLGLEKDNEGFVMRPVMKYDVVLPSELSAAAAYPMFKALAEEEPTLEPCFDTASGTISVLLMGRIHAEIFVSCFKERFDRDISLREGRVLYRETITGRVEGVGHYEPLRHYAEVHLILEPLERGAGMVFESTCMTDDLDLNWQRLILTHLAEKQHIGVLTGSPVTDMKITLAAGKDHLKHTEGGDFRQATYRAVRHGLMKAESILLEPFCRVSAELQPELLGRALTALREMGGEYSTPVSSGEFTSFEALAPAAEMNGFCADFASYTHGKGRISYVFDSFRPCRNPEKVIEEIGYQPERDMENTPDSVFCSHGAGVTVSWKEVERHMHLESCIKPEKTDAAAKNRRRMSFDDAELEEIMEREFGPIRRKVYSAPKYNSAEEMEPGRKQLLVVDGYNYIFSDERLKRAAEDSLDLARALLQEILADYAAFTGIETVLVFDAYRTPGRKNTDTPGKNFNLVYTEENETADLYIERFLSSIGKNFEVKVVTNDNLIRLSALRTGVLRLRAEEFRHDLDIAFERMKQLITSTNQGAHKSVITIDNIKEK